MKTLCVYIETGFAADPPDSCYINFPDDATEAEIEAECEVALETVIANRGSGWYEVEEEVLQYPVDYTWVRPEPEEAP